MPTEKPFAPEGCVWGPWWDDWCWLCIAPWKSVTGPIIATQAFIGGEWKRVTEACEGELLRLAAQRDRLVDGLEEMRDAMRQYQMDVDEEAPYVHRKMMQKADALITEYRGEG